LIESGKIVSYSTFMAKKLAKKFVDLSASGRSCFDILLFDSF